MPIKLSDVKFPVFECNEFEIAVLRRCYGRHDLPHLCNRIKYLAQRNIVYFSSVQPLLDKIRLSINGYNTLDRWMIENGWYLVSTGAIRRDEWIKQILNFNGVEI